jgi:glycosyltransferase involved in cell wall biosynthesis
LGSQPRATASDCLVIVTARNEAERIGATLAALALAFPGATLFLADDGSADATAAIAHAAGARVVRSERVGKGAAATAAATAALREADALARGAGGPVGAGGAGGAGGTGSETRAGAAPAAVAPGELGEPIFVLCDGDLADSAGELGALAATVRHGEADMAVAAFARRVGGGVGLAVGFARWAIVRRCGLRMTSPISGQRALRARTLRAVLPFAHGFGMELGMTIDAVRAGYRLVEVELPLRHRASGRTPAGFIHRARQLADFARAFLARR